MLIDIPEHISGAVSGQLDGIDVRDAKENELGGKVMPEVMEPHWMDTSILHYVRECRRCIPKAQK